jgi:type VI secretion system secreted protein Hcp
MANALVDYFLEIKNVVGESTDKTFPDRIQLQSWQWAEENSGRWGFGSGGGAGKVEMKDFEFRMVTNTASPTLFLMCAQGTHIEQAKLICRKSGGTQEPFLTISFQSGLVSSFRTLGNMPFSTMTGGGSEVGSVVPTDEIKINFAQITFEYRKQLDDGSMGAPSTAGYSLKLNAKL